MLHPRRTTHPPHHPSPRLVPEDSHSRAWFHQVIFPCLSVSVPNPGRNGRKTMFSLPSTKAEGFCWLFVLLNRYILCDYLSNLQLRTTIVIWNQHCHWHVIPVTEFPSQSLQCGTSQCFRNKFPVHSLLSGGWDLECPEGKVWPMPLVPSLWLMCRQGWEQLCLKKAEILFSSLLVFPMVLPRSRCQVQLRGQKHLDAIPSSPTHKLRDHEEHTMG